MVRLSEFAACVAVALLALPNVGNAQRPPARPAAPSAPVSSTPQQTTASFADWTLRCTQAGSGQRFCEVVQGVQQNERTVAQIALGRPAAGQKLQLTLLVPPNITIETAPSLVPGSEGERPPVVTLAWRRCIPVGCIADTTLSPDLVTKLRGWTDPARILFADAAGRPAGVPFSARGLAPALDALGKEEGAN